MPTYRKDMGKDAMANIIKGLYNSEELDKVLTETNSLLLVKPHPLTPYIDLPRKDNFIVLNYGEVESNQELLAIGDMMISDYSSVCVDYALTERPVLFYMPDHEKFITISEPLFDEFYEMSKYNNARTPSQLAEIIRNPTLEATEAINKIFEAPEIKGTCYSENVFNVVSKRIEL